MSSITIHEMDDALNERLTRAARSRGTSKNALIKEILAREMGIAVQGRYADDYREFAGSWSAAEYREFEIGQRENAAIDPGEWSS